METVVLEAVTSETVARSPSSPTRSGSSTGRRSSEQTRRHIWSIGSSHCQAIERDMRDYAYEYWFVRAVDDGRIVGYTGGHVEPRDQPILHLQDLSSGI